VRPGSSAARLIFAGVACAAHIGAALHPGSTQIIAGLPVLYSAVDVVGL
jgi:hypothetical protein